MSEQSRVLQNNVLIFPDEIVNEHTKKIEKLEDGHQQVAVAGQHHPMETS